MKTIMTERTTRESFIVRIYRYDPEDTRTVTGLVEATDGTGATAPFASTDELCAILKRFICMNSPGAGNPKSETAMKNKKNKMKSKET